MVADALWLPNFEKPVENFPEILDKEAAANGDVAPLGDEYWVAEDDEPKIDEALEMGDEGVPAESPLM